MYFIETTKQISRLSKMSVLTFHFNLKNVPTVNAMQNQQSKILKVLYCIVENWLH